MTKTIVFILTFFCAVTASAQGLWRTDFRHAVDPSIVDASGNTASLAASPDSADGSMLSPAVGLHRAMSTTLPNGLGLYGESAQGTVSSIGAPRIPVIMVAFADLDFLPSTSVDKVSRWLGEEGYSDEPHAVGSVADYFRDNSYGLFTPSFDVVARVTLSHPLAYYGAHSGSANDVRPQALVREALELATAQGVDFAPYAVGGRLPIVGIVHAGPGEQEDFGYQFPGQSSDDYIWAHYRAFSATVGSVSVASYIITNEAMRSFDQQGNVTKTTMTGIGTFCHEFCHALGLPDTYDVNGSTGGACHTPGLWDLMDYQFMLDGYRPGCLSAYERCCLGWLDIPLLTSAAPGSYTLAPLDSPLPAADFDNARRAYCMTNPANPAEHFIFENRQPSSWHVASIGSTLVLGTGMLAWHIDYASSSWAGNTVNVNAATPRVSVVPADGVWQQPQYGTQDYAGDLFPGATQVTVFDGSVARYATGGSPVVLHSISEDTDGSVTFCIGDPTAVADVPLAPSGTPLAPSGPSSAASGVSSAPLYDLQGRRVALPTSLYLHRGKVHLRH